MYAPEDPNVTEVLVTPVPPTKGSLLSPVKEYTKPFSVVEGQTPKVVKFPFKVTDFAVIELAAEAVTA